MSEFDKHIVLVCDKETGDWSIVHQSKKALPAKEEAFKVIKSDKTTPVIMINTADFINF